MRAPERVASVSLLDPINTFARLSYAAVLRTIPTLVPGPKEWALPRFLAWVDGQGVAAADDRPAGARSLQRRHAVSGQYADRVNARVLDFLDGLEGIDVRDGG
ncbi:hypothetical protein [Streptomyces sp. NBC_01381]|uniref:hypothetical protein n=1 Tax=Streptomyces sp. NBC_01381 TaxID=2903845 RepID=UPI002B1D92DD|nr:hypothetical protein [Streptomyces sp. NBC_01381]